MSAPGEGREVLQIIFGEPALQSKSCKQPANHSYTNVGTVALP